MDNFNNSVLVIIILMTEVTSKTQQLIYRASYRKHRERLADIRHNVTGVDFMMAVRVRPEDKKKQLQEKMKQGQIQSENSLLQHKISAIKGRHSNPQSIEQSSAEEIKNLIARYERKEEDSRLQIQSDYSDGQPVKCIIPAYKSRATSYIPRSKVTQLSKPSSFSKYESKPSQNKGAFVHSGRKDSFTTTHSDRAVSQNHNRQKLFNLPERNQYRQVLHKRTLILSSTQSCLLELSLIEDRMLIAAYIMGIESYCVRELLTTKRTKEIVKEYQDNYDDFYAKLSIEQVNNRYQYIKILSKDAEIKQKQKVADEDHSKQKAKAQTQFLKRNYYTLLKGEEVHTGENKDKPTITHEKLQEIVERLAAPKRYLLKGQPEIVIQRNKPVVKQAPPPVSKQSKISIRIDDKQARPPVKYQPSTPIEAIAESTRNNPRESDPRRYEQKKIALKQTDSIQIKSASVRSNEKSSLIVSEVAQKPREQKEEQQDVQYLDGEDNYEQQFQNPSVVKSKIQSNPSKVHAKSIENNSSIVEKQSKKNGNKQSMLKNESGAYSNIYEQEEIGQNQHYEDGFEQEIEVSKSKSKNASVVKGERVAKKVEQQAVQQQYAEQFDG